MKTIACLLALGLALPVAADEPEKPSIEDQMTRGLLLQHQGRMIFTPCRDRSYATVEDGSPDARVTNALTKLGLAEGKNLYVEFMGKADGGTLRVSGINFAHQEARCQNAGGGDEEWRAAGTAPAWSLVVGAGRLILKRDGVPDLTTTYTEITTTGSDTVITTAPNLKADWRFQQGLCSDSAANVIFGWHATLNIEGKLLTGCAWKR